VAERRLRRLCRVHCRDCIGANLGYGLKATSLLHPWAIRLHAQEKTKFCNTTFLFLFIRSLCKPFFFFFCCNQDTQFLNLELLPVMGLDAQLSSHPIIQSVQNPDEINELFDSITYNKVRYQWIIFCIMFYFVRCIDFADM
jgi:hypothetical protein